jgi:nucleotide-binding universal stress UspA family protein
VPDTAHRPRPAPYGHVAVCLDRSDAAAEGVAEARRLCGEGCRLSLVHVATAPWLVGYSRWGPERQLFYRRASKWLREVAEGVPGADPVLMWGHPAERVVDWAWSARPDLLVAASHAGRMERMLGSFVRRVAVAGPSPALLLPAGVRAGQPTGPDEAPYRHIACCVDDSPASARALEEAHRLRGLGPGRLSVVHAAPRPLIEEDGPPPAGAPRDIATEDDAWLRRTAAAIPGAEPVLLTGLPPEAVLDWAGDARPDLLVAAAHRGPVERVLLGSFAARVALEAPCPVLLTR